MLLLPFDALGQMHQIVQGALDFLARVLQLRRIHQRSGP
jgi:hypothetical protein